MLAVDLDVCLYNNTTGWSKSSPGFTFSNLFHLTNNSIFGTKTYS